MKIINQSTKFFRLFGIAFLSTLGVSSSISAQSGAGNKVLIVSGGGARGAWGVGVVENLIQTSRGYKAVFGTSTGSLTAPLTLLVQDTALMAYVYTHVTQNDIFNVNPFTVKETHVNGQPVVTTTMRPGKAFWRLLIGKESLGESKPLLKLIKAKFTQARFDSIKNLNLHLNVAVTNMTSGHVEIKSSDDCNYADMCDWIWASANEPVWMSFLHKDNDSVYADGGAVQVIPVVEGLNYAFQKGMDTVDVVINNSAQGIDNNWKQKGSWLSGLERLVEIFPNSISNDDVNIAVLMTLLHDSQKPRGFGDHDTPPAKGQVNLAPNANNKVVLRIYTMPDNIAIRYRDELGFFPDAMLNLLSLGRHQTPPPQVYAIDTKTFNESKDYIRRNMHYQMKKYR